MKIARECGPVIIETERFKIQLLAEGYDAQIMRELVMCVSEVRKSLKDAAERRLGVKKDAPCNCGGTGS